MNATEPTTAPRPADRLRQVAAALGLQATNDGYYGPNGSYGIENVPDGLWRAVGPGSMASRSGVTAEQAADLLVSWAPAADEIGAMLAGGEPQEADTAIMAFVQAWQLFAAGEAA